MKTHLILSWALTSDFWVFLILIHVVSCFFLISFSSVWNNFYVFDLCRHTFLACFYYLKGCYFAPCSLPPAPFFLIRVSYNGIWSWFSVLVVLFNVKFIFVNFWKEMWFRRAFLCTYSFVFWYLDTVLHKSVTSWDSLFPFPTCTWTFSFLRLCSQRSV